MILLFTSIVILDVALYLGGLWLIQKVVRTADAIFWAQMVERPREIAADQFAATAFSGAEGEKLRMAAIASCEAMKEDFDRLSWLERLKDPHPTPEARIEIFKNYRPAHRHLGDAIHV